MTDKPILFSTPMVQAILEGRKTVTRRVIKFPKWYFCCDNPIRNITPHNDGCPPHITTGYLRIGYCESCDAVGGRPDYKYQKGDTLWVRETWGVSVGHTQRFKPGTILYRADHGRDVGGQELDLMKWRPSIHMPRWAARIFRDVVSVRAERLQEITEEDALAEGVEPLFSESEICSHPECDQKPMPWKNYLWHGHIGKTITAAQSDAWPHQYSSYDTARGSFSSLWDSLNAKRGYPWESNPWVWRIEFEVKT